MGIPVLIIGESGSGKTTSMRNFKDGELGIINVGYKPVSYTHLDVYKRQKKCS